MKPEISKIWTDALLSGEYVQGVGALAKNNRYCCLGVLCELACKHGVNVQKDVRYYELSNGEKYDVIYYGYERNILPPSVMEWAGMKTALGVIQKSAQLVTLAEMNDGGSSFEEIAQIIKQNVEEL